MSQNSCVVHFTGLQLQPLSISSERSIHNSLHNIPVAASKLPGNNLNSLTSRSPTSLTSDSVGRKYAMYPESPT